MSRLMDLVAGDAREILLVIGTDDLAALDEPGRFAAHLPLGSGLDPTWLDLFAEAARNVTGLPRDRATSSMPVSSSTDPTSSTAGPSNAWIAAGWDAVARIPAARPRCHRRSVDRPRRG